MKTNHSPSKSPLGDLGVLEKRADFGALCQRYMQRGRIAEIGVQYGVFTKQIASQYYGQIIAVDIWQDEEIYKDCCTRLGHSNQYTMLRCPSLQAAAMFPDSYFDAVYIDANHFKDYVYADILAWYPKVRSGGIIAGHDYCHYQDIEVIQAVTAWAQQTGYTINVTNHPSDSFEGQPFPTWWTIKK